MPEYRLIPDFPGYRVGDDGSVWSNKRGEWMRLKGGIRNGYANVMLSHQNKRRLICCHTLVLLAFVGPKPPGADACHLNDDRSDNRPSNLRWDTHANNCRDCYVNRRRRSRLTPEQAIEIRQMRSQGYTYRSIASHFNVAMFTIYSIVARINHKYAEIVVAQPA